MRSKLACVLAIGTALVMALSGCVGGGSEESSSGNSGQSSGADGGNQPLPDHLGFLALSFDEAPVIEKNQDLWTLPTDAYSWVHVYEINLLANDLVRTQCMHDAGFPEVHLRTDYDAPRAETMGLNWNKLFTVDLAKKYGYRNAPDPRDTIADAIRSNNGDWFADKSDGFMNAWDRCQEQSGETVDGWMDEKRDSEDKALWEQLHPGRDYPTSEEDLTTWRQEINTIDDQKNDEAANSPANLNRWGVDTSGSELQAAAAKWRDCMKPLGIVDLPAQPWDPQTRPPESLIARWGWNSANDPASADEIAVATHDAQCRQDSGWFDLLYEASWNQAQTLVDQHRDELNAEYVVPMKEEAEHDLQVIREYLPKMG